MFSIGWGQDCIDGVEVELWGECYNIEETIELDLSYNQLTGDIPPEICDLFDNNNSLSWWSFESHILWGNNLTNTCE